MTNQIILLLQTTPQDYETLILDIYIEWCGQKTKNTRSYQKLLTSPPLFKWFQRELVKLEAVFIKDAAIYKNSINKTDAYKLYRMSISKIFYRYNKPLLKHAYESKPIEQQN